MSYHEGSNWQARKEDLLRSRLLASIDKRFFNGKMTHQSEYWSTQEKRARLVIADISKYYIISECLVYVLVSEQEAKNAWATGDYPDEWIWCKLHNGEHLWLKPVTLLEQRDAEHELIASVVLSNDAGPEIPRCIKCSNYVAWEPTTNQTKCACGYTDLTAKEPESQREED
jgi:hypothetical protein